MGLGEELERIEAEERARSLREAPHILHPAGGLTPTFVYEPVANGLYVYKTSDGKRGFSALKVVYEDPKERRGPHWFLEIEAGGESHPYFFEAKPPKDFLFEFPDHETLEKWVRGARQSLSTDSLWRLNALFLRTFLDFPKEHEFSIALLFIFQSWLSEILPAVFYLAIKGEFGGGKTVTGEAIVSVCRHGYLTGNASPPFVARAIEEHKITIMIDELDTVAGTKDSDLNSIFRQGYRRGLKYSRVNPDTLETESYEVFSPKLFTVHAEMEEALQTRSIPIHVRETADPKIPIVNLDKPALGKYVYTENFLWYLDNVLALRGYELHALSPSLSPSADLGQSLTLKVDMVDMVDQKMEEQKNATAIQFQAEDLRQAAFERKKALLQEGQLSQLSQLTGRNVELMFLCFVLSNLLKIQCDADILQTFKQKLIEESERMEIGLLGVLKEVLKELWNEKRGKKEYTTDDGLVKISNKEVYDRYNEVLKKEYGQGISPSKFKEFLLEFGFSDALNRNKLKVPIPGDPEPKSRLCNIFTERVLRKLGIGGEEEPHPHPQPQPQPKSGPLEESKGGGRKPAPETESEERGFSGGLREDEREEEAREGEIPRIPSLLPERRQVFFYRRIPTSSPSEPCDLCGSRPVEYELEMPGEGILRRCAPCFRKLRRDAHRAEWVRLGSRTEGDNEGEGKEGIEGGS